MILSLNPDTIIVFLILVVEIVDVVRHWNDRHHPNADPADMGRHTPDQPEEAI